MILGGRFRYLPRHGQDMSKTPQPSPLPKTKSPGPDSDPSTPVTIKLPLHYAAIVQTSLEQSMQAQGREGARMLLSILDAFADAVGEYRIEQPEDEANAGRTE